MTRRSLELVRSDMGGSLICTHTLPVLHRPLQAEQIGKRV